MTRKTGAQANGGKIEGRFAALTSSLLARKGQAAPSNSPIADAAEETEAFTPGAGLIPRKLAPQLRPEPQAAPARPAPPLPQAAAPAKSSPAPAPKAVEAPKPQAAPIKPEPPRSEPSKAQPPKPEPPKTARIFAATLQGFAAPQKQSAPAAQGAPAVSMNVINEKSEDAGYPENPSAEDIAALEAEADEVVSYFENFGDPDEAAAEKDRFLGDPLDELDDDFDDFDPKPKPAPASATIAAAAPEPVKAGVTVMLDAKEFMRLTIGAGELELSAQELIAEAIEEYLDARGVESLGGCACLGKGGLGPRASKAVEPAED